MAAQDQVAERHHMIPLAQATTVGESTTLLRQDKNHILNRALNLTYVLKSTNREVAARPLADYLSVVEGAAPLNHFLPEDPQKHAGEADDKYYERVLQARLTRIKGQVLQELDQLIAAG